jgi:TatD DNase family protein
LIDTHSHIYSEEFDTDRAEVIQRAKDIGVQHIILPNVDSESLPRMLQLEAEYPDFCYACIGLHPTSVNAEYKNELKLVESELERRKYLAIGEIGIDLYWDKSFLNEQVIVFQQQLEWALKYNLPVIIHVRNSFAETMEAMKPFLGKGLKGVFHSFTGTNHEAQEIINLGGFLLGINGIVTFKNSGLDKTLTNIDIQNIILETDSPYLTPVPFRGKRNESAYINIIAECVSGIYNLNKTEVIETTTRNAKILFKNLG